MTKDYSEAPFDALPLGAVQPRGWMLAQLRRDLEEGFAGRLDHLTDRAAHDLFRERIATSEDPRAWWDAETRGNWLWGYVMMAHLAQSPEHVGRATALVTGLLATQDADGYIGIYSPADRYRHRSENGELWAQSRALLTLLAHHEATGDSRALAAVRRAVGLTLGRYTAADPAFRRGDRTARDALTGLTHGLCYLDALEWLHAHTGDGAYAATGVRFYEEFSRMPRPFPNDDFALPNLADPSHHFGGHAVHTAEHLRALLWLSVVAPDRAGPPIVERALRELRLNSLPSGALLGDEYIHGLPLPEAGYEYCTTTELAMSLASAIAKLGRAALGDWLETLVFNAAQGARMPDGRAIGYLSADTRIAATASRPDSHSGGKPGSRYKYSPTHDDVACCCNPNAVRLLPQFVGRMWMRAAAPDGLAAVAYGPCELRASVGGVGVAIVEETDYPFSDRVELSISPDRPVPFTLLLRRPQWDGEAEVSAPGAEVRCSDGWYRIVKTWRAGDHVQVAFSWRVRSEAYGNGEVAVLRGPLQFALPLAHRLDVIRTYGVPGFHDYDVHPLELVQGDRIPVLDSRRPDLGFALERNSAGNRERPWDEPPLRLRSGDATLVPLGCTLLRRAAFPIG